jgi:hypothetical protein
MQNQENRMTDTRKWAFRLIVVFLGLATALPKRAEGQISIQHSAQGNQASWVGLTTIGGAATAIDASVFTANGTIDICTALNSILAAPGGANNIVIDARGVSASTPACSKSPWSGTPPAGGWPSASILLPAGTIVTPSTWILPKQTKIIGEGPGVSVIQAGGSLTGALIQMGPSGNFTFGIAVSDLSLIGNTHSLDGIDNFNAEELSYVQRVWGEDAGLYWLDEMARAPKCSRVANYERRRRS